MTGNSQKPTFIGYPAGWFVVSFSDEIERGQVRKLKYFGEELVAFRTEGGALHIFNAHCPHLGANLAVGGRVTGDTIQCPFHGWRFDRSGRCIEVPSSSTIPANAVIYSWPVEEKNGLIFVYYHPRGEPPTYSIPVIEQYGRPGWIPWQGKVMRHIRVYDGDIVENMADITHFKYIHCTDLDLNKTHLTFEGHIARLETSGVAYPPMVSTEQPTWYRSTYYGPGYEITEYDGDVKNIILVAHTMVDEEYVDLRYAMFSNSLENEDKMQRHISETLNSMKMGLEADIVIWENKIFRERPVLCEGDRLILKTRKWYRSFFQ